MPKRYPWQRPRVYEWVARLWPPAVISLAITALVEARKQFPGAVEAVDSLLAVLGLAALSEATVVTAMNFLTVFIIGLAFPTLHRKAHDRKTKQVANLEK